MQIIFDQFQSFEELFLMGYISWKMGKSLMRPLVQGGHLDIKGEGIGVYCHET